MMPGGRDTVYDRYKKTGYLMGSKHRALNTVAGAEGGPAGDTEEENGGMPPDKCPNYRDAGDSPESCGECDHYTDGQCDRCDLPTSPNMVCDNFEEPAGPEETEGEESTRPAAAFLRAAR